MTYPFGESVTILRPAGADRFGDPTGGPVEIPVDGCVVWPTGAGGSERTFQEDTVFVGYTVLMPPRTDVRATDQVRLRGVVYGVSGEPGVYVSPFTGMDPGVVVPLQKAV